MTPSPMHGSQARTLASAVIACSRCAGFTRRIAGKWPPREFANCWFLMAWATWTWTAAAEIASAMFVVVFTTSTHGTVRQHS